MEEATDSKKNHATDKINFFRYIEESQVVK